MVHVGSNLVNLSQWDRPTRLPTPNLLSSDGPNLVQLLPATHKRIPGSTRVPKRLGTRTKKSRTQRNIWILFVLDVNRSINP